MHPFLLFNIGIYSYKSLSTDFTAFHMFWCVLFSFSFISKYFLISLIISSLNHWSFRSVLFNIYVSVNVPVFLLLLISNFIALYLEKICWIISVSFFKILFWIILWSNIWYMQKNVPCALEERYPIFLKWKVLYMFKSYIL